MTSVRHSAAERYYLIDGLRTVLSLIVVLFHYHDLFSNEPARQAGLHFNSNLEMPFFQLVSLVVENGSLAVMVFWSISGFIFAHVYADRRATTGWSFFTHRFSRLYPLHFVTLIYVASLQVVAITAYGTGVIPNGTNDLPHFMLQLAFASSWGFGDLHSFNLPIWSVSVEILSYAAFWVMLRYWGIGYISALVAFALCMAGVALTDNLIPVCGAYFFLAALGWLALQDLELMKPPTRFFWVSLMLVASLVPLVVGVVTKIDLPLTVVLAPICSAGLVLVAMIEHRLQFSVKWMGPIGDITYSTYLIHMPLQMTFVLLMLAGAASPLLLLHPLAPIVYIVLVVVGGHLCFKFFELPAQRYLRRRMLGTAPATAVVGGPTASTPSA